MRLWLPVGAFNHHALLGNALSGQTSALVAFEAACQQRQTCVSAAPFAHNVIPDALLGLAKMRWRLRRFARRCCRDKVRFREHRKARRTFPTALFHGPTLPKKRCAEKFSAMFSKRRFAARSEGGRLSDSNAPPWPPDHC